MKKTYILLMILLCLIFPNYLEAQALNQKISVQYKNLTIEEVLKDLSEKYKIQFSYSTSIVPVKQKVNLVLKEKSLEEVLIEIFKTTDIDFEEIGNHIVLKKNPDKKPVKSENKSIPEKKKITPVKEESLIEEEKKDEVFAAADTVSYFSEKEFKTLNPPDSIDEEDLRKNYLKDRRKLKQQYYRKLDSLTLGREEGSRSRTRLKTEFRRILSDLKDGIEDFKDRHNFGKSQDADSSTVEEINEFPVNSQDISIFSNSDSLRIENADTLKISEENQPVVSEEEHLYRPAQLTFLTPIGTNGAGDHRCVNIISFNLLAGRAAGLEGFEFGGLVNVEKDYVWGAQFAGLGNIVGNDVRGAQFSGLFNINGGNTQGVQFSGFMNIVSDNIFAGQFAGFMNVTGGRTEGFQAAGFMNLSGGEVNGAQVAGFMNVAGEGGEGTQVSGFMNVAADTLRGAQVTGFLNAANVVIGSQIGFINVADSVTGAQFGFFSFAKKGYRRLELWGGETLYGNIAFKTGTRYFYNIFAGGVRPEGEHIYWAYGYGFGGEVSISKKVKVNIDLLAFNIHKDGWDWDELNLLNQFRPTFGLMLSKKTSIFAGPVFNVMVSDHYNAEKNTYGSPITPGYAFYNETHEKINVSMWVGANAGIRF